MSFKLDTSKFKKIASDKHSTTMRHEDGHTLKIAHDKLSPKWRGKLADLPMAMSDGGEVSDGSSSEQTGSEAIKKENYTSSKKKPKKDEDGLTMLADGGVMDSPEQIVEDAKKNEPQQTPVIVNVNSGPAQQPMQAVPVESVQPASVQTAQPQSPIPGAIVNGLQSAVANNPLLGAGHNISQGAETVKDLIRSAAGTQEMPASSEAASPRATAQAIQPSAPRAPSDLYGTESYSDSLMRGIEEQKAGLDKEAQARAIQGQQELQSLQHQAQAQQERVNQYQKQFQELDNDRKELQSAIDEGHIDPKHYLDNMSFGGKILTTLSLMLGGFGSNGTDNNVGLKILNDNINRDIDAQKTELGKKENLLSANLRQFGNLRDATEMTRVQINDIVSNQLRQAAAQAATPMAQSAAMQAKGKLDAENAQMMGNIAMRRSLLNSPTSGGQQRPELLIRAYIPQAQQQEYFKVLKSAQDTAATRDRVLQAFDEISRLNTVGETVGSLGQNRKKIDAIQKPLIGSLSKETAGRFTEADAKFIEAAFPSVTDTAETIAEKRRNLAHIVTEKMHFPELKAIGIDMNASSPSGIKTYAPNIKK